MPRNAYDNRDQYKEDLDLTPIEIALGRSRPSSMKDEIMEAVKAMIQREKEDDLESIEEFWDLDVEDPDNIDLQSKYELEDMVEEFPVLEEDEAQAVPGQAETQPPEGDSEPPEEGVSKNPDS